MDVTTKKKNKVQPPTEGEWFEVNPQAINQSLFEKKRRDQKQESTRWIILEAFVEVKNNPERYNKKFKTMMPKKTWNDKTVDELKQLACELGDHNADWVEQALEWAQRICNGEAWKAVCNEPDTANWYRLVIWKNGHVRRIGGSRNFVYNYPPSYVDYGIYFFNSIIHSTVPLVALYDK